jgi:nucleosome binding factor SPN SPT16 subunit
VRGPSSSSRLPFAHPNRNTDPSCKSPGPLDLLFSNIKHLFFQPCDDELIVVIHVHLKSPIMIGKKKAKDVQFIREATDVAFDETGNRKRKYRYGDEDEIQLEQEERKRRAQLNKEFKAFAEPKRPRATLRSTSPSASSASRACPSGPTYCSSRRPTPSSS